MNKKFLLLIPVVLISIVLFTFASCNKTKTIKPERKSITEAVYASGFLVPRNEYKVFALSDGYIVAKYKEGGDSVRKGESIFQIQNDASAARLGASSAAYDLAKMNSDENSPVLTDLKNKIKSAEAKFKNDSLNYQRYKNMFDAQAVTKAQFDQVALTYEVSGNDFRSAKEIYNRTKDQLKVEVKNAQSSVASSGLDLANYNVKSMLDGMVYETYKDLGEAVRRNDLVAMVGEGGSKILELSVDQSDIEKIKVGQEVVVKMDVTGTKIFHAKVSKIYPNMNQNDQSFKVEAEFTEDYELNFVHASVEANIILAKKDNALIVPKNVLLANDEVEIKGVGMNTKVKIKKGLENLEFVEVVEGVKEGDEVVLPKEK
ncbi:MAG: HlyD family efflux transporter periplasmic adaptor subunit [Bacteroidota bacterium]